jgi:hypothetical protein
VRCSGYLSPERALQWELWEADALPNVALECADKLDGASGRA